MPDVTRTSYSATMKQQTRTHYSASDSMGSTSAPQMRSLILYLASPGGEEPKLWLQYQDSVPFHYMTSQTSLLHEIKGTLGIPRIWKLQPNGATLRYMAMQAAVRTSPNTRPTQPHLKLVT
ncbi:hypothetical protein WG66_007911 [Moniliophthora roreri]|nr:hypothetical protein WG66_007911 [Moniliophthora roreri]